MVITREVNVFLILDGLQHKIVVQLLQQIPLISEMVCLFAAFGDNFQHDLILAFPKREYLRVAAFAYQAELLALHQFTVEIIMNYSIPLFTKIKFFYANYLYAPIIILQQGSSLSKIFENTFHTFSAIFSLYNFK